MRNRVGYTIIGLLFAASSLTAACSDDEDGPGDVNGGESSGGEAGSGGSSAGKGGSNNGGSNNGGSNNGGSNNGGSNNGGSRNDAGAGGDIEGGSGGLAGMGGEPVGGEGGSSGSGAGSGGAGAGGETTEGGAAGAGGAGNPPLDYACGSSNIARKACSALSAASCPEGIVCSDCIDTVNGDREGFATCAVCLAEWDKVYQCGIDAYESGNLSTGVECLEGFGADYTEACYATYESALECLSYEAVEEECPPAWPLP